jgi:hypothetical protein
MEPLTGEALSMGLGKTTVRLIAAGVSICVIGLVCGLSSATCAEKVRQAAAVSGWTYSTDRDPAGRVTGHRAELIADEQLPELGATLELWTDATGKHVRLSSASSGDEPLACSYEQRFVLAQLDGGVLERVTCMDGPALTLHPALYDKVQGATELVIEADTFRGSTHKFRFRVAGLHLK